MKSTDSYDVIIVGAGAAGIACAQTLHEQKINFLLIEARSRIGGRIYSVVEPNSATPVELGAEFIHGTPQSILHSLEQFELPFYDGQDAHLYLQNKKLVSLSNFWEQMEKVMKNLHAPTKKDQNVKQFLDGQKKTNAQTKKLFAAFVEGFHAADLQLIGQKGLAATQETDEETLNGSQMFRLLMRYDLLFTKIFESFNQENRTHLHTELKKINWRPGHVELECTQGPTQIRKIYTGKKLVLTVPLGVLKSSALEWNPQPDELSECFQRLHMGHVQRIVFRFYHRFWEELSDDEPIGFLHSGPEFDFPTWWTLQPMRTPHLVAWQGGPRALEMSLWKTEERIQAAIKTLSQLTNRSEKFLNAEIATVHHHNWSEDPWTLGAYSYVGVDGLKSVQRLQRPFEDTIFLAGEATAKGSGRGTVHGAFESGKRVGARCAGFF